MRALPEAIAGKLRAAAAEVLAVDQAPSVDTVAAASGIPRATLYYHFSGKSELLDYMITDLLSSAADAVASASTGPGNTADRLSATLEAIIDYVIANPGLTPAMLTVLADPSHYSELATTAERQLGTPIRDLLTQGNKDGTLDVPDPDVATITILGATIVTASAFLGDSSPGPAGSIRENLVRQLMDGVRTS